MLSPLDLQNKKVVTRKKKYDKAEIDDYIDLILENYKEAFSEVQELQKKVKTLSDGIQYYRSIESTMQKALVLAEKTSKETKDAAILKAEAIEKDANTKASRIVAEAEQEYEKIKDKCVTLVQQFNQYKMQLKQVATAQLELVTSESFDVYSPEIDSLNASRNSLPPTGTKGEAREEKVSVPNHEDTEKHEIRRDEAVTEDVLETIDEKEDLDKTVILPDLKNEKIRDIQQQQSEEEELSILTADTIDLRDSIQQIQKEESQEKIRKTEPFVHQPVPAEPKSVQDALVMEPADAEPTVPLDAKPRKAAVKAPEILEPISEDTKEAPTLDSLLQSMNIGGRNNKKKKKGQEEDPFEFLGSVDDF